MTYSVSIAGRNDEDEGAVLASLVDALEQYGGEVTIFTFSGNDISVPSFKGALDLVYPDDPIESLDS